jgi:hypothetical protein
MQRRPHQAGLAMDTPKGIDGMRPPLRAASTPHVQSANRAAPTGNSGILGYLQPKPWFIGRAVYPTIAVSAGEGLLQILKQKMDSLN